MHVSLTFLHAISRCLAQRGLAMTELSAVGLGDALPSPPGMLSWADAQDRVERGFALSHEHGVALLVGEQISVRVLQVVGLAVLNAKTVREGISTFFRFAPLVIVGARFDLIEKDDHAKFVLDPPPASPIVTQLSVELGLSFLSHIASDLLQREKRTWFVHLRHEDPGHADVYARVFGCEPRFGQSENALGFAREVLDQPLVGGDDALGDVLVQHAEQVLAAQQHGTKLSLRVRAMLREAELHKVDIRGVSKTLALSGTALRRRLKVEDTTWSELVDEARRERALEALAYPDTIIKELSEGLGFSEPSAFHRAFRRWTGTTPSAHRLSLMQRGRVA